MEWLPIESAPKEYLPGGYSTRILLYCARAVGSIRTGHWYERRCEVNEALAYLEQGWWLDGFEHPFNQPPFAPTHWMPLPEPPKAAIRTDPDSK